MADLRTDYKDDVLDTSVNEERKYEMSENSDGTVSLKDVTEYLQVGDIFSADILNQIVAKITTDVIDALADVLANAEDGVLVGANAVKELKNTLQSAIDTKVTNSFTASRVLGSTTDGKVSVTPITTTELGYLDGVTSNIQTQLNSKAYKGSLSYSEIDNISTPGFYAITGTPLTLLHMTFDTNFMSQIICQADGVLKYRYKYGVWKDWETITKDSSLSSKSVKHATSADSIPWSGVTGKPTVPKYVATRIKSVTAEVEGEVQFLFSDFGLTSRPSVVVATIQNLQGFACYMYDDSTSYIRLIAFVRDTTNNTWKPIGKGTNVRIGLVVYA